jgi:hypothetical protein
MAPNFGKYVLSIPMWRGVVVGQPTFFRYESRFFGTIVSDVSEAVQERLDGVFYRVFG